MREQAVAYLLKSWVTASVVFPPAYTIYYLNFDPHPDGMIWLWCMIAVPIGIVLSLPCSFASWGAWLVVQQHINNSLTHKLVLCFTNLLVVAIVYVWRISIDDQNYSISFMICYWLTITCCMWLYRLKLVEKELPISTIKE